VRGPCPRVQRVSAHLEVSAKNSRHFIVHTNHGNHVLASWTERSTKQATLGQMQASRKEKAKILVTSPQLLTHSMEHNPSWENNRFSAIQELTRIHYCTYKCPLPAPILSQFDPVHAPKSHFLKIHLNVIRPSTPGFSVVSFLQISQTKPCLHVYSPHTCYMPHSSHSSRTSWQFLA